MHISRKSEYAIHSLLILAVNPDSEISVDELATMQKISRTYLAKVMQELAKAGLVQSSKGFQGGYQLTLLPTEITLAQVISTLEGEDQFYQCMNTQRECKLDQKCAIHRAFDQAYQSILSELETVRLSDLLLDMFGSKAKPEEIA